MVYLSRVVRMESLLLWMMRMMHVEPHPFRLTPTLDLSSPASAAADNDHIRWFTPAPAADSPDDISGLVPLDLEPNNVPMGWVDPRLRGGRMLDFVIPRYGEPLNVIISGLSDPFVLTRNGLLKWAQSIGYSSECLGLHVGRLHIANLGDGVGNRTEALLARTNFDWPSKGWPDWGTCWETIVGGNHFRAWKQDGPFGRTRAWFLAVSAEHSLLFHHAIVSNGYDLGRDLLVSRAVQGNLPIYGPPYNFQSVPGYVWRADLEWEHRLLEPGHNGVNHNITIDGRVAVLTIRRLSGGEIGHGTQPGKTCETGSGSHEVLCPNEGNQLAGGDKHLRKAVAFWMRAAQMCGKALRIIFGGMQGVYSAMIW